MYTLFSAFDNVKQMLLV